MEQIMVMDDKVKRRMGIICMLPAIAFGITLLYYFIILSPLLHGHPEPKSAVGITSDNYTSLFIMLAISATISLGVLIYCLIHLLKIKTINTPAKMEWALILICAQPICFILFWYFQIKKEQKNMPIYPDVV